MSSSECLKDKMTYTILFGDSFFESLSYKEYSNNRTVWDKDFYRSKDWNPSERDWDFIISKSNELTDAF